MIGKACACLLAASSSLVAAQRLNEIVVLGSYKSYHQLATDTNIIREWSYDHPSLADQAMLHNIRNFHFDVLDFNATSGEFTVGNQPGFDNNPSCDTLSACLRELRTWSDANSNHVPFFIRLEVPILANATAEWTALNTLMWNSWEDKILTPANLTGNAGSLREALIGTNGWPNVDDVRGRALFLVNSQDYLTGIGASTPWGFQLRDLSETPGDNDVFLYIDNAQGSDDVGARSAEGYIVLSRADNPNEFVFPLFNDTAAGQQEIFQSFFNAMDQDNDGNATFSEFLRFGIAYGLAIDPTDTTTLTTVQRIFGACADNTTMTLKVENSTCIQTALGNVINPPLPPMPSSYQTVDDVTQRRDGNFNSGANVIATTHFVRADAANTGGYTAALADTCEFYLNPASDACRSPPADVAEACRPLTCFPAPTTVNGAFKNGLEQPLLVLAALSCALFL